MSIYGCMDLEYLLGSKPQNSGIAIFLIGSHGRFTIYGFVTTKEVHG